MDMIETIVLIQKMSLLIDRVNVNNCLSFKTSVFTYECLNLHETKLKMYIKIGLH